MTIFQDIGRAITHNHTLKLLFDPVKPIEKIVNTAHHDVASVVSYGGKHLIKDVDNITGSFSNALPFIIGGVVVVVVLTQMKR